MKITEFAPIADYERVLRADDPDTGLTAIIALHDTSRGPALGGCRIWPYADEEAALNDVLRLSRGMTYKNALAELPFGGGKSVIIGDSATVKSDTLLRAMGRFVQALDGRYIIAEDVGTCPADMSVMRQETPFVAGREDGGSGDPSPATAWGAFRGIQASVRERLGRDDLKGLKVALQGIGNVGWHLARHLSDSGAVLWVTDVEDKRLDRARRRLGATPVAINAIYDLDVDLFAPCALGAVINDDTIGRLKAKIVAGSANNQLAEDRHGSLLKEKGILYAPDYAINAGGVINIYYEYCGAYDRDAAYAHVGRIHDTLTTIYGRARGRNLPTHIAADRVAEDRFRVKEAA